MTAINVVTAALLHSYSAFIIVVYIHSVLSNVSKSPKLTSESLTCSWDYFYSARFQGLISHYWHRRSVLKFKIEEHFMCTAPNSNPSPIREVQYTGKKLCFVVLVNALLQTINSAPFGPFQSLQTFEFFMCDHKLNIHNNHFTAWKIIAPCWEPDIPCQGIPGASGSHAQAHWYIYPDTSIYYHCNIN
jgi:hypothetical protein